MTEDKLAEIKEASYLEGQRMLLLSQLKEITRRLEPSEEVTRAVLIGEREEAIQALRSLCEDHGDNEWEETLHLADIINKHLGRHLE